MSEMHDFIFRILQKRWDTNGQEMNRSICLESERFHQLQKEILQNHRPYKPREHMYKDELAFETDLGLITVVRYENDEVEL